MGYVARVVLTAIVYAQAQGALGSETVTYTYDALGRLRQVVATGNPSTSRSSTYSHDPAGNRTSVTTAVNGADDPTTCTFSVSDAAVNAYAGGTANFRVTKSGSCASSTVLTFHYAATGDLVGTLTFAPSDTVQYFGVYMQYGGNELVGQGFYMNMQISSGPGTISDGTAYGYYYD